MRIYTLLEENEGNHQFRIILDGKLLAHYQPDRNKPIEQVIDKGDVAAN